MSKINEGLEIKMDSMILTSLSWDDINVYMLRKFRPIDVLTDLATLLRKCFIENNFDWDALAEDDKFRRIVLLLCSYSMNLFKTDDLDDDPCFEI